jgi:sporulation protein YlmC with PRC-barrel domain
MASGSASGAANGALSGGAGSLALAGSAASSAQGAFSLSKGMSVLGPDGEKIGKIREVIADSRGRVQSLLVRVDGQKALLPAANFNGKAVVSAMGEGQIKRVAQQQDAAAQD